MPLPAAPLKITLYSPTDEPTDYIRSIVPWGILKKALALSKEVPDDENEIGPELLDAIGQLVVDVFGGQFTLEELDRGADTPEVTAILTAVVARAGKLVQANPTYPPEKKRKR